MPVSTRLACRRSTYHSRNRRLLATAPWKIHWAAVALGTVKDKVLTQEQVEHSTFCRRPHLRTKLEGSGWGKRDERGGFSLVAGRGLQHVGQSDQEAQAARDARTAGVRDVELANVLSGDIGMEDT